MYDRTHASFFSGVGGLDLGLERAGWRTVSFSEIDPYACAVLAERWPGVPNLGSIVDLAEGLVRVPVRGMDRQERGDAPSVAAKAHGDWTSSTLWTGGFPCQDLSIAGKRRGLDGSRSGLAFAYLGLVERHRPPWVLLENVPGLLSSNRGRDLAVLLGRLAELGYGVGYRTLDARYFGVAQRRRRVFILATRDPGGRAGAERASEVLSIAARGGGHSAAGSEAGAGLADRFDDGVGGAGIIQAVTSKWAKRSSGPAGDEHHHLVLAPTLRVGSRSQGAGSSYDNTPIAVVSASPDPRGDRAPDGLAGRLDDLQDLAATQAQVWVKRKRAQSVDDDESWGAGDVSPTINGFDVGDTRATTLTTGELGDDPLLPIGLDSHRYRCCGNGVVSNVAEAIGRALISVIEQEVAA